MKKLLFLLVTLLFLVGCSDSSSPISTDDNQPENEFTSSQDNISQEELDEKYNDFLSYIENRSKLSIIGTHYDSNLLSTEKEGAYQKFTYQINESRDFPNLENFGANNDIIFCGNIIDGYKLFDEKIISPININKNPITISLSLESSTSSNYDNSLSTQIDNPTLSNTRDAIHKLINENINNTIPVSVEYSSKTIYNEEQLNIALGIPLANSFLNDQLGINWTNSTKKTKKIIKFKQKAFSIDMDTPYELISKDNDFDKIKDVLGEQGIPLYVSSVDYGAIVYVVIESELTEQELDAQLNLSNSNNGDNGISSQNTSIKVLQYGGENDYSDKIIDALYNNQGIFSIKELLENQTLEDVNALPISYKLRYLVDNSIAKIGLSTEYTRTIYVKVDQPVTVSIDKFIWTGSDGFGNADIYTYCKIYAVSNETGEEELIAEWEHSSDSEPYGSTYYPEEKGTYNFVNFNPGKDHILVSVKTVEYDAFDNDYGSTSESHYLKDWTGEPFTVEVDTGHGVSFSYDVSVEMN